MGDFTLCYARRQDIRVVPWKETDAWSTRTRLAEGPSHRRARGRTEMEQNCCSRCTKDMATATTTTTASLWSDKEECAIRMARVHSRAGMIFWFYSPACLCLSSTYILSSQWKEDGERKRRRDICWLLLRLDDCPLTAADTNAQNPTQRSSLHGVGAKRRPGRENNVCSLFRDVPRGSDLEEVPESEPQKAFPWLATASSK